MNNRVKQIRQKLGLSMEIFGKRIGITRSAISRIEAGIVNVTNQNIIAICREFNANEKWLRSGEGDMFLKMSNAELAADIVSKALNTNDNFILNTFITLGQLSSDEWKIVKKIINSIKDDK